MKKLKGFHYSKEEYQKMSMAILTMDLTSRCNYKCDWCCNSAIVNKSLLQELTNNERANIVCDAAFSGIKTLTILGAGEPSLDDGLQSLIELAYQLDLTTVLYTNLTGNIDKEVISFLYNKDVSVVVKMDSLDAEYFKKRYHVKESVYDKFINNLQNLIAIYKLDKKSDIYRVVANMVLTYENLIELENISKFCSEASIPLYVRPVRYTDGMNDWEKLGNPSGSTCSSLELTKKSAKLNSLNEVLFAPSATQDGYCAIYTYGLTIRNNGIICLCPDDHTVNLGNIRNKSIVKAFQDTRNVVPGCCRIKNHKGGLL